MIRKVMQQLIHEQVTVGKSEYMELQGMLTGEHKRYYCYRWLAAAPRPSATALHPPRPIIPKQLPSSRKTAESFADASPDSGGQLSEIMAYNLTHFSREILLTVYSAITALCCTHTFSRLPGSTRICGGKAKMVH